MVTENHIINMVHYVMKVNLKNLYHGKGKSYYKNKRLGYVGDFKNGKMDGYGKKIL